MNTKKTSPGIKVRTTVQIGGTWASCYQTCTDEVSNGIGGGPGASIEFWTCMDDCRNPQ